MLDSTDPIVKPLCHQQINNTKSREDFFPRRLDGICPIEHRSDTMSALFHLLRLKTREKKKPEAFETDSGRQRPGNV